MTRAVVALGLLLTAAPSVALAQDRYPTQPPPPAPLEPAQFPPFQEDTLANGLRLVLVESHENPVLSLSLAMPAGSSHDPAGKDGLADMVAALLDKGAGQRTAEQIAAEIEGVGGSLGAGAGADFMTVSTTVLAPNADLAFGLLSDVVTAPTFPASEIELVRTQTLSGLQLQLSQPASLASRFFDQALYGEHPYARSATPASVRAITRDDLVAYQESRLVPQGALLVIAGDITMEQARRQAEAAFADWTGAAPAVAQRPAPPARTGTEILLVHRPGSVQSNIVVGNTTFRPADPLRHATIVANKLLGGGADARLFMILREEKGWTYGAYSNFSRPLGVGSFQASAEVRTEVTDSSLVEIMTQLRRLRDEPVPASELDAAQSALVGSFPLTIETAQQIAGAVSNAILYDLGTDYLGTYRTKLAAVTAADLARAARTAVRPDSALIVVVGDGAKLYEKLSAIAPVRIVTPEGDPLQPADLTATATAVALDPRKLVAGRDSFAVMVQGNPFGYTTTDVARTADGWTITQTSVLGPVGTQTTTLTLDERLGMRAVKQTGKLQGMDTRIDVVYGDGKATGSAATPQPTGGVKEVTVDAEVPAGALDDNAVATLLPTMPWAAGAKFTIPVFASGEGTLQPQTFTVAGAESVTVPAGTAQAWKIEVTGGQVPVTYWVEQAAPYRVLKIAPVGVPLEMVRVK